MSNNSGKEGKVSIKWDEVVQASIPIFKEFVARRVVPTLRTIHYALVSKNIIPNTKSAYKGLSSAFVKARQDGVIKWDWLADEGRDIEEGEFGYDMTPEDYAEFKIRNAVSELKEALEGASNFSYSHWKDQKYYVEVWIEKNALRATFKQFLMGDYVTIVPSRGFSSWTFLKEASDRIQSKARGKTPVIVYFGDFDPSGEDIERFLRDSMNGFFGIDVEVKRVGVTMDQIEKYSLPSEPRSEEELSKLHKDARFKNWAHGDFVVELDALLAYVPDEFKRIVQDSVAEYYDSETAERVADEEEKGRKYVAERMKEELPEKIKELLKELGLGSED